MTNDCKSWGGMVAVKREPWRVLEAVGGFRNSWVGSSEGEVVRVVIWLFMVRVMLLKELTYKAAISNGCLVGFV